MDAAFSIYEERNGQAGYRNRRCTQQYFARFDLSFMFFAPILTPILCQKIYGNNRISKYPQPRKGKLTMAQRTKLSRALWVLMATLLIPAVVHAVTYSFPENEPAYLKDEDVVNAGTKLYLFHSGTEDVRKAINVNDVLTVFRGYPFGSSPEAGETGKVKILSFLGEYYYEAEVVEGSVHPGYLARKGTIACFITSFRKTGNQQSRFFIK